MVINLIWFWVTYDLLWKWCVRTTLGDVAPWNTISRKDWVFLFRWWRWWLYHYYYYHYYFRNDARVNMQCTHTSGVILVVSRTKTNILIFLRICWLWVFVECVIYWHWMMRNTYFQLAAFKIKPPLSHQCYRVQFWFRLFFFWIHA